jgi:hypothetical protein
MKRITTRFSLGYRRKSLCIDVNRVVQRKALQWTNKQNPKLNSKSVSQDMHLIVKLAA